MQRVGEKSILASLPTRKDFIPENSTAENRCIELPDINLNCFVISINQQVTDCGKNFDFTTHLYGHQIDDYIISEMKELYPYEGSDYVIWGKMKSILFDQLIECFKNSRSVKSKYTNLL